MRHQRLTRYSLQIFNYFVSSVTIFGSLTWISILASHVGFMRGMKAQGISRDTLPYKAVSLTSMPSLARVLTLSQPFEPYLTYFALFFTVLLSIFKGFDACEYSWLRGSLCNPRRSVADVPLVMPFDYKNFITSYIGIPVYVLGYFGYKCESWQVR